MSRVDTRPIRAGQKFKAGGRVFKVTGRGLRNSYTLVLEDGSKTGVAAGSIKRDALLERINRGDWQWAGFDPPPRANRRILTILGAAC